MIQEIDPDLLGLQESFPEQTRFVSEGLPDHECYELGRRGEGKREESCAVLWRRERFEVLDRGTFWLGPKPSRIAKAWDAALPRICTWLRLKDLESGRSFVFANTHFDHRGRRARLESAKLLASQWPGEAVVLTGDLNAGEDSRPLAALREGGFVDSYRSLYRGRGGGGDLYGLSTAELGEDRLRAPPWAEQRAGGSHRDDAVRGALAVRPLAGHRDLRLALTSWRKAGATRAPRLPPANVSRMLPRKRCEAGI